MVLDCFDKKDYKSIKILYDYVLEDFEITDFLLRTELI